ncbi:MAG: lipoprotein-releasing system permease protein [Flavobacterium sp.]
MNFSLYIAKRYIFTKSKNNAINIITRIASGGIIVGAMALFVVLSVFGGLRDFSLSFSNDLDPDLKVFPKFGKSFFIADNQITDLKKINGVTNYSKIIEERVLFVFDGKEQVTYLKGIDSNFTKVNKITDKIFNGQWLKSDTYQVVIGNGISNKLSLGLFDFNNPFEVYVPKPGKGGISNPDQAFNKEILIPVGMYSINEELDSKYVFADLTLVQNLLEFAPNQVSGVEILLEKNANAVAVSKEIVKVLNIKSQKVIIKDRAELNATLHKMLNTENIAIYLIFTLVIVIALFNLIGALIMMILDKKSNLKTLNSLGSEIGSLRKIFLLQGSLISIFGAIVGLTIGIAIVVFQQQTQLIMITETLPYPVVFSFQNVVIVFLTIALLGLIASLIASSRVTKKLIEG